MFSHRNVKIEINQYGKFTARVEDVEITEATLEAAQQAIEKALGALAKSKTLNLKVIGILQTHSLAWRTQHGEPQIKSATLTGLNRTTGDLMFTGLPKDHTLARVMPDTPGCRAKLEEYIVVRAKADALNEHVNKFSLSGYRSGRIPAEKYGELLDAIELEYLKSDLEHKL